MDEVESWLRRKAAARKGARYLEDALLSNRFWPYAAYRLRYFLLVHAAESLIHLCRFLLVTRVFSPGTFTAIVFAHAGAMLLGSFWWGALEVMRDRVRFLYRTGKPYLIPREIGHWISWSVRLSLLVLAAGVFWIVWHLGAARRPLGPVDVYVLAVDFGLALTLTTRAYHSGIFALRRIYRPFWVMLAVELAMFGGALVLWKGLGAWSVPAATLLSTSAAAAITIHYAGRTYRLFGLAPSGFARLTSLRISAPCRMSELLPAGLSYAAMGLDAVVLLALLRIPAGPPEGRAYMLFFLLAPVLRASFEWARLFYFDLKRLEGRLFANLLRRFERSVSTLAVAAGVACWVVASLLGSAVYGTAFSPLCAALLPFFLAVSFLANAQIQAFARGDYWRLFASGGIALAGFATAGSAGIAEHVRVFALALAGVLALAPLAIRQRRRRDHWAGDVPWFLEWLTEVRSVNAPVRISAVQFASPAESGHAGRAEGWEAPERRTHARFAERVARRLKRSGHCALVYPRRVVWYESGTGPTRVSNEWLMIEGGGLIEWIKRSAVRNGGGAALESAARDGLLGDNFCPGGGFDRDPVDVHALREMFGRMFPVGVVYDPEGSIPRFFDSLSSEEKRVILFDAAAFVNDCRPHAKHPRFEVTSFSVAGELRLIFLVEAAANVRLRSAWRDLLKRFNLRAAMIGSMGEQARRAGVSAPAALSGSRAARNTITSAMSLGPRQPAERRTASDLLTLLGSRELLEERSLPRPRAHAVDPDHRPCELASVAPYSRGLITPTRQRPPIDISAQLRARYRVQSLSAAADTTERVNLGD